MIKKDKKHLILSIFNKNKCERIKTVKVIEEMVLLPTVITDGIGSEAMIQLQNVDQIQVLTNILNVPCINQQIYFYIIIKKLCGIARTNLRI